MASKIMRQKTAIDYQWNLVEGWGGHISHLGQTSKVLLTQVTQLRKRMLALAGSMQTFPQCNVKFLQKETEGVGGCSAEIIFLCSP